MEGEDLFGLDLLVPAAGPVLGIVEGANLGLDLPLGLLARYLDWMDDDMAGY